MPPRPPPPIQLALPMPEPASTTWLLSTSAAATRHPTVGCLPAAPLLHLYALTKSERAVVANQAAKVSAPPTPSSKTEVAAA